MTTERLQEFVVLAGLLNFSKAAEKLYLTQSILSRHIRDMEEELHIPLFIRSTHGVALTEEGKYFLREIEPLLKKISDSTALLQASKLRAEGTIPIVCSEQTLNTKVLSFIRDFQTKYDTVVLDLHPTTAAVTAEAILSAPIYLSPCDLIQLLPEQEACVLLSYQSAYVAYPPRHPFGSRQSIRLTDLRDETLLVPFSDEMFGPYAQNALLAERINHGHLTRLPVENAETALLLTELTAGVTIIPHHLKHKLYAHTRALPIDDGDCRFPIYCYINHAIATPAAELFFESISKYFSA